MRILIACFLFILTVAILGSGQASAYPAILEIILNSDNRGTFFVETTDDGDFLLKADDFDVLGLPAPESEPISIEEESYHSLSAYQGLEFKLDEATLALEITVTAGILPVTRIDFTNRRPDNVYEPEENSFFLNYGLTMAGDKNDALQTTDLTHELAFRNGKTLFLTDGIYSKTTDDSSYIRLLSRFIHDDRTTLRRIVAGDHTVLSGPLGSQVLIGGAGYARNYDIDPYAINYPAVQLGGAATTPSVAEIYIDGMLMRKEEIPPGPFMLENITRYEGAGDVEIVIRDAFNKEQRIAHPFYLAENLLIEGRHEFSYSAGALREDFGIESNGYGDSVFSGFHRYGYRDWLTVGLSAEYGPDFFSLAPRVSMKWQHYGTVDLAIGSSIGDSEHSDIATAFEYFYRNRTYSTGFKLRHFGEHYARLDDILRPDRPELEAQFRLGYSTPGFGSLNLAVTSNTYHIGEDRDEVALTYNRRLSRDLSMYTTLNQLSATEDETILLVGFNYSPWRHHQVSARIEDRERSSTASISLQRDPPIGQGYGYRATLDVTQTDVSDTYALNGAGQYNGRYGIARAEADLASVDSEFLPSWLASVSGAVTSIGGQTFVTRPIRDSFSLVKVGELAGVRVVKNSEIIGRTDDKGQVLIPEMTSFYDNEISIRDEDIPIEYGLETSRIFVQPPLRSGSCIIFSAQKIQPLVGKFRFNQGGIIHPYDFRGLTIRANGKTLETQTGYDGEFYIDTSEAGDGHAVLPGCEHLAATDDEAAQESLKIEYNYDGTAGIFELAVPASDELFVELGDIVLNGQPVSPQGD